VISGEFNKRDEVLLSCSAAAVQKHKAGKSTEKVAG
jgi:hypothetical protein